MVFKQFSLDNKRVYEDRDDSLVYELDKDRAKNLDTERFRRFFEVFC